MTFDEYDISKVFTKLFTQWFHWLLNISEVEKVECAETEYWTDSHERVVVITIQWRWSSLTLKPSIEAKDMLNQLSAGFDTVAQNSNIEGQQQY